MLYSKSHRKMVQFLWVIKIKNIEKMIEFLNGTILGSGLQPVNSATRSAYRPGRYENKKCQLRFHIIKTNYILSPLLICLMSTVSIVKLHNVFNHAGFDVYIHFTQNVIKQQTHIFSNSIDQTKMLTI